MALSFYFFAVRAFYPNPIYLPSSDELLMRDPASFLIGNQRNYIQMNMAPMSELLSQYHESGKKNLCNTIL